MTQVWSGIVGDEAGCKTTYNAVQARTVGQILSLAGALGSKDRGWVSQMSLVGEIKSFWDTQGRWNLDSGIMMLHNLAFFYLLYP